MASSFWEGFAEGGGRGIQDILLYKIKRGQERRELEEENRRALETYNSLSQGRTPSTFNKTGLDFWEAQQRYSPSTFTSGLGSTVPEGMELYGLSYDQYGRPKPTYRKSATTQSKEVSPFKAAAEEYKNLTELEEPISQRSATLREFVTPRLQPDEKGFFGRKRLSENLQKSLDDESRKFIKQKVKETKQVPDDVSGEEFIAAIQKLPDEHPLKKALIQRMVEESAAQNQSQEEPPDERVIQRINEVSGTKSRDQIIQELQEAGFNPNLYLQYLQ